MTKPPALVRLIALAMLALAAPSLASAQEASSGTYYNQGQGLYSIQSIQQSVTNLGNVVSAAVGNTVFTVNPATGAVTRTSGNGARLSSGTARSMVTVSCGNANICNTRNAAIRLGSVGLSVGRVLLPTRLTVAAGTATIVSGPTGTNPVDFVIGPIGKNSTKTFYVGGDYPIAGDNSGLPTGPGGSGFYVYISQAHNTPKKGWSGGLMIANVFRPLTVGLTSNLSFGTVMRPSVGAGMVMLDPMDGQRTITGTGAAAMNMAAATRANYVVTGEGGQTVSIIVPPTFQMTGPGAPLTVTTMSSANGTEVLNAAGNGPGTLNFMVGGSFPIDANTEPGNYSGAFVVVVQYN